MGIHSHCQQTLPLQNSIIFLYHFPENSNVNSYCHATDLKNNNGSLRFLSGLYNCFFQVNLKCQWTCPLPWEITLIYWFCRWTEQSLVRWGNIQLRCDRSWLALTILSFCKKAWQKCWPIRVRYLQKRRFKPKTNDCIASRLAIWAFDNFCKSCWLAHNQLSWNVLSFSCNHIG